MCVFYMNFLWEFWGEKSVVCGLSKYGGIGGGGKGCFESRVTLGLNRMCNSRGDRMRSVVGLASKGFGLMVSCCSSNESLHDDLIEMWLKEYQHRLHPACFFLSQCH